MPQALTIGIPVTLLGMGVTLVGMLLLWGAIALIGRWPPPARPSRKGAGRP